MGSLATSVGANHMNETIQMDTSRKIATFFLFLLVGTLLFSTASASAVEKPRQGPESLLDSYHRNRARLETSSFGLPLTVDSAELDDRVQVDVYGIFDHPFSNIVKVLKVPANWCDIVSIHPNTKACTASDLTGAWQLTFYLGTKKYQPPEDTRQVIYRYRYEDQQPGYMNVTLNADAGPFGTKDHKIRFEAVPLEGERTFVHVSYAYKDSAALRLVTKIYFATIARGKVGFSVIETDRSGNPVYISGPRGAVERSAVRYYFAIHSFMNTLRHPEENRFSMRINEWYALASRYGKQLVDMDKKDYLASKTREQKDQVKLQQQIGTGLQ